MNDSFSGVVKLDNISDFISTSQNCVVSSERQLKSKEKSISTEPVKISLQDCLACSGCVTTAETILLENQSTHEFLRRVDDPDTHVAITISSQSRAAIAVEYNLTAQETLVALFGFFREMGVDYVFDLQTAKELSCLASLKEFMSHHQTSVEGQKTPILASSCPGWVCYVEKTYGDLLIPYLSKVRSPQATMGILLKSHFCQEKKINPDQLYHCTVMPCFDKKLEASRKAFVLDDGLTPEVDSCLTTTEVIALIKEKGIDLRNFKNKEGHLDSISNEDTKSIEANAVNGSSGDLLEFIFRQASKHLYKREIPYGPLPLKPLRNQNFQEVALEDENHIPLLKFAYVYGFRNIQTLVRKIKNGQCDYDFVEVMACPSGCLNGGGQPKPSQLSQLQQSHQEGICSDVMEDGVSQSFGGISLATKFQKIEKSSLSVIRDW